MVPFILLDDGPGGEAALFEAPERVIRAHDPADLPAALRALDAARAAGFWIAGWAAYEAGHALLPRLPAPRPAWPGAPLLEMGVFPAPEDGGPRLEAARARAHRGEPGPPAPDWDLARYRAAFERVMAYIRAGDIFQANLTFPMRLTTHGGALATYGALVATQPVGHGALVALGGRTILSRSPEMFFRMDAAGRIEARPMKGTAARGPTKAEDSRRAAALAADEKCRAENLMIVDLLRNDLSRVAEIGSVRVPALFAVESYATVHQMTSTVTAQLLQGTGFAGLMAALFPCGSVTGAPKIRAMQVIAEIEDGPRGPYCGAIGWMAPDGRAAPLARRIKAIYIPADEWPIGWRRRRRWPMPISAAAIRRAPRGWMSAAASSPTARRRQNTRRRCARPASRARSRAPDPDRDAGLAPRRGCGSCPGASGPDGARRGGAGPAI